MTTDAMNPNMTASTMEQRHYDATLDKALELRDYDAAAVSADATEATVEFYSEATTAFEIVVRNAAIGGTVDGSNFWTVIVEADNETTFTAPATLLSYQLTAAAGLRRFCVTGEEAERLRVAASMTTPLRYIRVRADETGTTAGNLTYGVYIEPLAPI